MFVWFAFPDFGLLIPFPLIPIIMLIVHGYGSVHEYNANTVNPTFTVLIGDLILQPTENVISRYQY